MHDVIVLGAGVSGLACARGLAGTGAAVLVLDRADKPGGRCATRWHDGEPFDYGPLFLHGSDPAFLRAAAEAGTGQEGWPRRVEGEGTPCQPRAFFHHEKRLAFAEGLTVFPRRLAAGLDIRLNTLVTSIHATASEITVETEHAGSFRAHDVVVAFALEQSAAVVRTLGREAEGITDLLGMFSSVPCLAVVAGYPAGTPLPAWDVRYPEEDAPILLVGNETSKRPAGRPPVLVIQAGPRWSRQHLDRAREEWTADLLAAASRLLGPWAASPQWVHAHRWRYSRLDPANELAAPLIAPLGSSRLGLCGDLFAPGGGIQAAWQSGERLGRMLSGG